MDRIEINLALPGRDQLNLVLEVEKGVILKSQLNGVGCPAFLRLLGKWRPYLVGPLKNVPLPMGVGHEEILLREALMKANQNWNYPYLDEELCHCRAIPTQKVDQAIVGGCHTVPSVSKATSAGTSCGTCKSDIESVINYRLSIEQKK